MAGVYVGSFTKQNTTGNQDITLPSGCPDLTAAASGSWAIMFWTTGYGATTSTWSPDAYSSLGFTTGAANSFAVGATMQDAVGTSVTARRTAAKCLTLPDLAGGGLSWEADFVSFPTSTTMRINWTTNATPTDVVMFTIFTGLTGAKVVNWTTPTVVGTKVVIGVGFNPDLVLHAGAHSTATPASDPIARLGFGAMNKHGQQWANAIYSNDAVTPSNASRWQQTDACFLTAGATETETIQAQFSSTDADGFTTYFSTVDASARQVISLCMDGVSSKLGAFPSAASGTQAVDTRHGFTLRGGLLSTIGAGAQTAPGVNAAWAFGGFDTTNQRAASLAEQDAQATTEANSVWSNTDALLVPGAAGTTIHTVDYSSSTTSTTSFTVSASAGTYEILYLLVGDTGTDTFPQTGFDTSAVATATAFSNQKKGLTLSTGRLVTVYATDASTAGVYYSDGGSAWTRYTTIPGWSNGSIAAYVDSGGTERLVAVWKQSGTGGGRTDTATYIMVGAFNAGRTTLTWGAAVQIVGASASRNYYDVVAHPESTGGQAHVVASRSDTPDSFVEYAQYSISGSTPTIVGSVSVIGTSTSLTAHTFPSIDIDPTTKRLHVAWSAGATGAGKGIRYRTASYSAGTWTWATEVEVDNTSSVTSSTYPLVCRWYGAGSLVYIGTDDAQGNWRLYESTSFTSFTTRNLAVTHSAAIGWYGGGMGVDGSNGDVHFLGRAGLTVNGLVYTKWTRATTTLGSTALIDQNGLVTEPYANVWYSGSTLRWVYTRGNNSPYAVAYDQLVTASDNHPQLLILT